MSFQNWHKEFDKFWPEHSKVSKILTLMGSFWAKYILCELKKYRGATIHDNEEWCKIWSKTDLLLRKWHEEFGKLSPEHSKVSKLELWWDSFVQSRKCMSQHSIIVVRRVRTYAGFYWRTCYFGYVETYARIFLMTF